MENTVELSLLGTHVMLFGAEMLDGLRVARYLILGRWQLWQYYTNVTWRTCEKCLAWHGRIAARPDAFPEPRDGCERKLLPFPARKLPFYREKARLMRERAQAELERRRLFQEAVRLLSQDPDRALSLFDRAGAIDVYIPELERLVEEHRETLSGSPELRQRLREVFLRRWGEKFAKPRYERLPERLRQAQERWGLARIKELFP